MKLVLTFFVQVLSLAVVDINLAYKQLQIQPPQNCTFYTSQHIFHVCPNGTLVVNSLQLLPQIKTSNLKKFKAYNQGSFFELSDQSIFVDQNLSIKYYKKNVMLAYNDLILDETSLKLNNLTFQINLPAIFDVHESVFLLQGNNTLQELDTNSFNVTSMIKLSEDCFDVQVQKQVVILICASQVIILNSTQLGFIGNVTLKSPFTIIQNDHRLQFFTTNGTQAEVTTFFKGIQSRQLIVKSDFEMQILKLDQTTVGIATQDNKIYKLPVCSQYQKFINNTCVSCEPRSYSLSFNSPRCYTCSYFNSSMINKYQQQILTSYCDDQIDDRPLLYDSPEDFTITVLSQNEIEDKRVILISVLSVIVGILFIVPWFFLVRYLIQKRQLMTEVKKQKNIQHNSLLELSELGSRMRFELLGPAGERFQDALEREQKFQKVAFIASLRPFNQAEDHKKNTCAICVEDFVIGDFIRETQCNHVFHDRCLMLWAQSKLWANLHRIGCPNCPNCNSSLLEVVRKKVMQSPNIQLRNDSEKKATSPRVLDVRGLESEAYYTINEQPMVANVEGIQNDSNYGNRWVNNQLSDNDNNYNLRSRKQENQNFSIRQQSLVVLSEDEFNREANIVQHN